MQTFKEYCEEKIKKSSFKQKKSPGVRDIEDDLSKDFKGHVEKNGTVEPFELVKSVKKEAVEYRFGQFDRVRSTSDWRKTGEINLRVPGDGTGKGYYEVIWDNGTRETVYSDDLEAE